MAITTLSTIDVYNVLSGITNITDICTVFNQPPSQEPNTPYIVLSKPTDNPESLSYKGALQKRARIWITVVWNTGWDDQETIESIINVITNEIVNQGCLPIRDWNGVKVSDITEEPSNPLLYDDKRRQYQVQDYIFIYNAK